jgi:hypothetical protein
MRSHVPFPNRKVLFVEVAGPELQTYDEGGA